MFKFIKNFFNKCASNSIENPRLAAGEGSFFDPTSPSHPSVLINLALEHKQISVEEFAEKCGIDLDFCKSVCEGKQTPTPEFIAKSQKVFPLAYELFEQATKRYDRVSLSSADNGLMRSLG